MVLMVIGVVEDVEDADEERVCARLLSFLRKEDTIDLKVGLSYGFVICVGGSSSELSESRSEPQLMVSGSIWCGFWEFGFWEFGVSVPFDAAPVGSASLFSTSPRGEGRSRKVFLPFPLALFFPLPFPLPTPLAI